MSSALVNPAAGNEPHILLLCATRRGEIFLERLGELLPGARLTVVSFPEEPWEPPFLERVRALTERLGGTFHLSRNLKLDSLRAELDAHAPDLLFAVSWRYLVSGDVIARARLGAFVFHDSLLPRYRGFAPTVWAIVNGERETGVTLLEMAAEIDRGRIVDQVPVPIGEDEAVGAVMEKVTAEYLRVLERNLPRLLDGTDTRAVQDETLATYGAKRHPEDNRIDWSLSGRRVRNLIRATSKPYTGAFTFFEGRKLTVWSASLRATPRYDGRIPGRVVEVRRGHGVLVLAGEDALLLREVQLDGEPAVPAEAVLTRIAATLGA